MIRYRLAQYGLGAGDTEDPPPASTAGVPLGMLVEQANPE
jgi:hypothetical protein